MNSAGVTVTEVRLDELPLPVATTRFQLIDHFLRMIHIRRRSQNSCLSSVHMHRCVNCLRHAAWETYCTTAFVHIQILIFCLAVLSSLRHSHVTLSACANVIGLLNVVTDYNKGR